MENPITTISLAQATLYAEFCVLCDRQSLPLLNITDYLNKLNETNNMTKKLDFSEWLDKYFSKDDDHSYYTWTFTDDGMHPDDKSRWKDDDLLKEYDRYCKNDEDSHVGLEEYAE